LTDCLASPQVEAAFVAFLGRASRRTVVVVRILLLLVWAAGITAWAASEHGSPNKGGSLIMIAATVVCAASGQ